MFYFINIGKHIYLFMYTANIEVSNKSFNIEANGDLKKT